MKKVKQKSNTEQLKNQNTALLLLRGRQRLRPRASLGGLVLFHANLLWHRKHGRELRLVNLRGWEVDLHLGHNCSGRDLLHPGMNGRLVGLQLGYQLQKLVVCFRYLNLLLAQLRLTQRNDRKRVLDALEDGQVGVGRRYSLDLRLEQL